MGFDSTHLEKLSALLANSRDTLKKIEQSFNSNFPFHTYPAVLSVLQALLNEDTISQLGFCTETLVSIYLLQRMGRSHPGARMLLMRFAASLEQIVRDDTKKTEQLKCRQALKEFKRTAKEAVDSDRSAFHGSLKVFFFKCLLETFDLDATPAKLLSLTQDEVDAAMAEWAAQPTVLKEKLRELTIRAEDETELNSLSGLGAFSTSSTPQLQPTPCRPLPCAPSLFPGELHFILGTANDQVIHVASNGHSEEWEQANDLVKQGSTRALSAAERQQLIGNIQKKPILVSRLGLSPHVVASLALNNAEAAAAIVSRVPDATDYFQRIIEVSKTKASVVSLENVDTIVLHGAKALRQRNVNAYINRYCAHIRDSNEVEAVKNFATTLNQLINKGPKDNKELYVSDGKKAEMKELLEPHKSLHEVATWLNSIK